jgi:hypothetical protein
MKFDERNPKMFLIAPFLFHGNKEGGIYKNCLISFIKLHEIL